MFFDVPEFSSFSCGSPLLALRRGKEWILCNKEFSLSLNTRQNSLGGC